MIDLFLGHDYVAAQVINTRKRYAVMEARASERFPFGNQGNNVLNNIEALTAGAGAPCAAGGRV